MEDEAWDNTLMISSLGLSNGHAESDSDGCSSTDDIGSETLKGNRYGAG
jgi:hypothetical protein